MNAPTSARRMTRFALAAIAFSVPTLNMAAQQSTRGAITGVVKDETGAPIAGVEVTAIRSALVVRTDTAGQFAMSLPAGSHDMSFRRLAFEPVVLMMQVFANDTSEVDVTLTVVAQKLTGVVILADPVHRRVLQAFEARRKQGFGHFITRAQIENRSPSLLSDMVRLVPGTVLIAAQNGRTVLRFSRVGGLNCPPQIFIDGMLASGFNIDDMPPNDVEGVELYAGAGTLPPEFNRFHGTATCGTVVIWTRIPGNDRSKP